MSTMADSFLAIRVSPDVQRKAQEEGNRAIGSGRLSDPSDRQILPYINAVVEEARRWHPIAPMSLPYAADEDDSINDFRILKRALLVSTIWWFTRNSDVYHDPKMFKPARSFPLYSEPPATGVTLGFGRQIYPGSALADASLFLIFA